MKHMIRLTNHTATDIMDIFHIADEIRQGKHADILKGKSIVMFFPKQASAQELPLKKASPCWAASPSCSRLKPWIKKRRCRMYAAISVFGPTPLSSGTRISASLKNWRSIPISP